MQVHRTGKHTYDATDGAPVPDLLSLPGVAGVQPALEEASEEVHLDTAEKDLTRADIALWRRTGGTDDGWHLELPVGPGEREELRRPIRRGAAATTVPRALRSLVQVHARGRALQPIATVRTRRAVHRLVSEDGTALAELCDDRVTAEVRDTDGSLTASSWREWELELLEGSRQLVRAADELLRTAGGSPSRAGSRLVRAVGAPPDAVHTDRLAQQPSAKGPAGAVVLEHLREQVSRIEALDPHVRRDAPDAVHAMRVSTRRLRSALASFEPLLDAEQSRALREELKWLAGVLGAARDAEVMRDRLTTMAAEDSPETRATAADPTRRDGVAQELTDVLGARYRDAHDEVLRALDSRRYFRLLDALDSLVESPPWTGAADEGARTVLPRLVRRDWRRVRKHVAAADDARDAHARDGELHEVRKAAKRLRYACEAMAPVFGSPAARLGDAAKRLQEVLGEHQDSVVSRDLLRGLAAQKGITGDAALTLGRLHLIEEEHAERAGGHYDAAWRKLAKKKRRRWLAA